MHLRWVQQYTFTDITLKKAKRNKKLEIKITTMKAMQDRWYKRNSFIRLRIHSVQPRNISVPFLGSTP